MACKPMLLDRYELLPTSYQYECRIRHVFYGWITVVCWLTAILGSVAVTTTLHCHRDQRARETLVATAMPLYQLRDEIAQLQYGNEQRLKWCQWVESAKPDDDAFQILATIAATPQDINEDIKIDRLDIKLPLEYPVSEGEAPPWAIPHVAISARVSSPQVAKQWIQRLNASDRIDGATSDSKPVDLSEGRIELTATPQTTRVLP